jgi:hypothetical protein
MEDAGHVAEDQKKERAWTRPLVTGVISGIIVLVFIQPILGFLWRFLLSNIKSMRDGACIQAALGYTDRFDFLFMATLILVTVGVNTGFAIVAVHRAADVARSKQRILSLRVSRILWVVLSIAIILSGTVELTYSFVIMQLKASFYQRLAVLAPKISEQEYKEYLASWAAMHNEEDYRRIVESMDASAKKSGTTLPQLLPGARVSD